MKTWKDVSGFEGVYRVSDDGDVQRVKTRSGTCAGTLLKHNTSGRYHRVTLWNRTIRRDCYVHRLVLESFVGECPEGMEGCHNDGDKSNNRLGNLRWDTHIENNADKLKHGTGNKGEKHGKAKLLDSQVLEIKKLLALNVSQREIAKMFGICSTNVSHINSGQSWSHILLT